MNPTLVNGWWLITDGYLGTTNTSNVNSMQITNATNVYNYLNDLGWSLSAIAGVLGNMHLESALSPAYIQDNSYRDALPNQANSLSDVPNSVMISYYSARRNHGIGLVQWDGYTPNNPPGQKLVSFATRYSINWYDGDTQMFRIKREQETDIQFQTKTINGVTWSWSNYPTNSLSPEDSAYVWMKCYESAGSDIARRKSNARYWYNYFYNEPTPPTPPTPPILEGWITGEEFSDLALAYNGQYIPYSQCDCMAFVNMVWQDIPAHSGSLPSGTNSFWRSTATYNTTSPDQQTPCPQLWYKETIANCLVDFGEIPPGALLFHQIGEDGPPPIPSQYRGDGIGNFVHVGIYVGNNKVMQSGGRDSASVPGGGVHLSTYDPSAWNYVAFVVWVDCYSEEEPPDPDPEEFPYWIVPLMALNKKRRINKYV